MMQSLNETFPDEPRTICRRLAAIAFADVAGFSRLMGLSDVDTLRRWRALRQHVLDPHMARQGGRIAEIAGDAILVEFTSVVNAMRWAVDVQRAQQARLKEDPAELRIRIGVNLDDVIDDDGILQGEGVNIAARIHQAAEPGQIVVTAVVRDCVMNRLALTFEDLGTPPLKNIVRTVHLFSARWAQDGTVESNAQPYLQWSTRPTVAVLPFQTIGGTDDDTYFGDGITDRIITDLSRSRSIYVIARSSTLRYRERDRDLRQIAEELDVRYVLDGTVQRQTERLRINTELTDVALNRPIWSRGFDGSTEDIFEFQDRIATNIAGSLEPRLRTAEVLRVRDRPTENLDAYHCVLKALSRLYLFTSDSYREAGELLERATQLDPSYAQAHAYLAWWLNFRIGEGWSQNPDADRARAITVSQYAIELDREDAFALTVAAHIRSFVEKKPGEAIEMFDEALAFNHNAAFTWALSALTLAYLGRADEALDRLQNVWRLDPFDPLSFYFWIIAGIAEFIAGRYNEAISWLRKCRRANPRFIAGLRMLAASLALSGDKESAQSVAHQLLAIEPSFTVSAFLSWYPLQRAEDLARLRVGLRAAGLPE
jgi:TolB-like protein/class 3 adenylate cyclase/Tfp pilus assembly protein PilF